VVNKRNDRKLCETNEGKNDKQDTSFVNGILIFTNMMLDNMDGKQARRTKTSSPLGELVDHGKRKEAITEERTERK
jgi:CDP-alcohol phosphatidyltransferase